MAQLKVFPHRRTAQVEVSVLHADVITAIGIVLYGERWSKALGQHVEFLHQNLYVASRKRGVLALTLAHRALCLNAEFAAELACTGAEVAVGCLVEHELRDSVPVAQVNENHASHLPHTLNPSGKGDCLTGI